MVPNKFNMIDLDGLDIIESQGVIVFGLYNKLVESIALCRYQCIYNWKFNSIPIPPTYVELDSKEDGVWINDGIVVSQDDTIHIYTIEPDPTVINPLDVISNGVYNVPEGVTGFNPVSVQVPPPVIEPLEVAENGLYNLPSGVDGFGPVTVNVSTGPVDDWTGLKAYIESNGTQYINTGYSVKDNSKFEVIANPSTTQPTYGTIFGTRVSNDDYPTSRSCILATAWASNLGNVNWGSGINRLTNLDKGNKTKYLVQKDRGIAFESESLEGIIGFTTTGSTQSATTASLMLFTLGLNGSDYGSVTHCNMKLYRFRIYEGDELLHEYLPWQENGVVCLKDTVSGSILYNVGTGDFVYGADQ